MVHVDGGKVQLQRPRGMLQGMEQGHRIRSPGIADHEPTPLAHPGVGPARRQDRLNQVRASPPGPHVEHVRSPGGRRLTDP
ncbi:MAG: hypothetical protein NVS3B24_23130 [Candidatus Dormibacteria bacterium]